MVQTVEMTYEEKVKMYMKCTKRELIEMLLQNQALVEMMSKPVDDSFYKTPIYQTPSTNPNPYTGYRITSSNPFFKEMEDTGI